MCFFICSANCLLADNRHPNSFYFILFILLLISLFVLHTTFGGQPTLVIVSKSLEFDILAIISQMSHMFETILKVLITTLKLK
jgi:hypothetical protein